MANGTGLPNDHDEVIAPAQAEQDTEDIIEWKTLLALEKEQLDRLRTRDDFLTKVPVKTRSGIERQKQAHEVLDEAMRLIRAKMDFFEEQIAAYEMRRIQRIFSN